ncbi:MAG: hydroxyacid dehydrogenase [Gemmatimonadetes bacterium]|nr:hydroxyacid dehydrogenase [Gemmatimonadota bacterium]
MTRVLVADKFERVGVDGLKDLGCEVIERPDIKLDELPAVIREVDPKILVVRSKKISQVVLEQAPRLALVIRAGAGIDTIDVAAASRLGIFVANCPGKNSIAVAELVMGLLLSVDRRIPDQVIELRRGEWSKGEYSKARGLHGRTLGIVGLGQIGREIASRAKAFGMQVIAWSRQLTIDDCERLGIHYAETPLDVARLADAVTINVASTADTKHLVNAEFLGAMKPGAYLINTSRGSIVDEPALLEAIVAKRIRCGLDVYQGEPGTGKGSFDSAVAKAAGVYGTHHVGASTDQAQTAIAHEVIRIVQHYLQTGVALHCVNRLAKSSATHVLSVRHRNRPGVLAHVFKVLVDEKINVEEVENIAYHGAEAASARIHVSGAPSGAALAEIARGNDNVISVDLSPIRS